MSIRSLSLIQIIFHMQNISSKTINQKTLQLNKSLEDYRVCEEWLLRNEEKLLQKEHVKFSLPNEIRNLFIEYDPNISNFGEYIINQSLLFVNTFDYRFNA